MNETKSMFLCLFSPSDGAVNVVLMQLYLIVYI